MFKNLQVGIAVGDVVALAINEGCAFIAGYDGRYDAVRLVMEDEMAVYDVAKLSWECKEVGGPRF